MAKETTVTTNPMEITGIVRNQTFALYQSYSRAEAANGKEPLTIYSDMSRIRAILIGTNGMQVNGNIKPDDIPAIVAKSNFAINKDLEERYFSAPKEESAEPVTAAYTEKLTMGALNGKTPAEVLIANPADRDKLLKHADFLAERLAQYPKNQAKIDAINEAVNLLDTGRLNKTSVKTSVCIPLYAPGMRPLLRKTREDGFSFVYEIKIGYFIGADYPVLVEIQNYYAPVTKDEKGLLNVQAGRKDNNTFKVVKMKLLMDEWLKVLYDVQRNMRLYEELNAKACFNDAEVTEKAQAQAYRDANPNPTPAAYPQDAYAAYAPY